MVTEIISGKMNVFRANLHVRSPPISDHLTLVPGRKTVVFIVYFLEHLKPSQTLVTPKGKKGRDTGRY